MHNDISSFPATATTDPGDPAIRGDHEVAYSDAYAKLHSGSFANWRLSIEGSMARPAAYSLPDLKAFAARTQITRHTCEEGWTAIAEWTGVPLRDILDRAGIHKTARHVNFYAYDGYKESIDMLDALHMIKKIYCTTTLPGFYD